MTTATITTTLTTRAARVLFDRWGWSLVRIESDATLARDDGACVYHGLRRTWRLTNGRRVIVGWYRERLVGWADAGSYALAVDLTVTVPGREG